MGTGKRTPSRTRLSRKLIDEFFRIKVKMDDYYRNLEVSREASQEEIKAQYSLLIQAWHPDKFRKPEQKAKAEQRTKSLNNQTGSPFTIRISSSCG